jgi:hypothetical protein
MAITGQMALAKLQVGREVVPGTAVAATRKQPIMSGNLTESVEFNFPQEQRESFHANYRGFATKRSVEVSGMEIAPTYEDLPWFLNFAISSNMDGAPTAISAQQYAFTPNATVNDLGTATLEVGDDTQAYQVDFAVISRLELNIAKNAPSTLSVDWLGKSATAASFTSNLSDRVTEDINGALALAYIDASSIGSTAVTNVIDARITIESMQTQFWALDGSLTPTDVYRNAARAAAVEMNVAFTDTTEYAAWQSNISGTGSTQRLIRLVVNGSSIAGTTPATTKSLTVDLYTVWEEAPFGEDDGLRTVGFSGQTVYNTGAGTDFAMTVVNDVTGGLHSG